MSWFFHLIALTSAATGSRNSPCLSKHMLQSFVALPITTQAFGIWRLAPKWIALKPSSKKQNKKQHGMGLNMQFHSLLILHFSVLVFSATSL